jgi:hypothetical protein
VNFYESPSWRVRFPLLDVRKIPRPDRSGVLAVLFFYAALCTYTDIANLKYMTAGFPSIYCYLFPWGCGGPQSDEDSWQQIQRHYHAVLLYTGPGTGHGKKKVCTCHIDLKYLREPIQHMHAESEAACDSDEIFTTPREWTDLGPTWTYQDNHQVIRNFVVEDKWRWHCE